MEKLLSKFEFAAPLIDVNLQIFISLKKLVNLKRPNFSQVKEMIMLDV